MTKFKMKRYIPEGYKEYSPELGDYPKDLFACYINLANEKPQAVFYTGKQYKPTWHFRFENMENLKKKVNETISRLMSWEDRKAERKEERKKELDGIVVGDLFSCSWGYEQTNVDFYQCIKRMGKRMVIAPIASKTAEGSTMSHGMADDRMAIKDAFLEDKERYPNLIKQSLSMAFGILRKTTEQEKHYCSWYA